MLAVTARRVAAAGATSALCRGMASSAAWETLAVSQPAEFVTHVALNRPDKRNAMNKTMWREVREVFESLDSDPDTRAVVLSGNGKGFTGGLDLAVRREFVVAAAHHADAFSSPPTARRTTWTGSRRLQRRRTRPGPPLSS